MKVGFITNIRAPYRSLQMDKFAQIKNIELTVYYTNKESDGRKWERKKSTKFKEVNLNGIRISNTYGYFNFGLREIIKDNDILILGGYEQPTMIFISLLCRLMNKKYILLFDGISTNRLEDNENKIKKKIKNIVIKSSSAIMANGTVGKRYFEELYNYPSNKIYNQYLTVDGSLIKDLSRKRSEYRELYRERLGIKRTDKVLIYSGRLISIKNVESIIKAVSSLNRKDIVLLFTGGGPLEERLKQLAKELNVKLIVTGFIENQERLFKHYFAGDALILPTSVYEVWGLVVNEAMYAGLPVLVSNICGCSLDLVEEGRNGYTFNPNSIDQISKSIDKLLYKDDIKFMGEQSKKIIELWSFENSANEFLKLIRNLGFSEAE